MVEWNLEQETESDEQLTDKATHIVTTEMNEQGFPFIEDYSLETTAEVVAIPIPTEIQKIKKENLSLAIDWRVKTSELFQTLFSKGYVVVGIERKQGENIQNYLLKKTE
jgi:predicted GNAT superfamily acetyltransferase